MKLYTFRKTQLIPAPIEKAWEFFSCPKNLALLTPEFVDLRYKLDPPDKMFPGLILSYRISPILGIPIPMVWKISSVVEPTLFVDEQVSGPYGFFQHQHHFTAVDGRTEMVDVVHYSMKMGLIGRAVNACSVAGKLEEIFAFRKKKVDEIFGG